MRARLLVLLAAVCYGTSGVARELGPANSTVPTLASLRSIVGAALLAIVWLIARRTGGRGAPLRVVPAREWFLAALGMALFAVAYFMGMRLTGIATGTVVALASAPMITGAMETLLWGRAPSLRWLVATVVAIAGISLLVFGGGGVAVNALGVGVAVVAGLGYAVFAMSARRILDRGVRNDGAMTVVFGLAGLMLLPGILMDDASWVASLRGVAVVGWLGAVTVAAGYWLYSSGLRVIPPSDATMLTLAEPVVASVLAAVLLGQHPTVLEWLGIAIVVIALAVAARHEPSGALDIVPLSSRPDLWTTAARWSVQQWRHEFPTDTIDTYLRQYREVADGTDRVLQVWAALSRDGSLVGVATLVDDDELPDALEPGPWLAALYVAPGARRAGVGSALVSHVVQHAASLGHDEVFLYTTDQQNWYERRGWVAVRDSQVNGVAVSVMRLTVGAISS